MTNRIARMLPNPFEDIAAAAVMPRPSQLQRVAKAIDDAWKNFGESPFPLYDREAEQLARAAMVAMRE